MLKPILFLVFLVFIAGFILRETFGPGISSHGNMDHTSHMNKMANEERLAEVATRSVDVMPFNLHDTKHHFVKNAEGGVQQVVARASDDNNQVELVRTHLKEIREQFLQGDFSGPAHIHGDDMPGLRELRESKPGQVEITYKVVDSGAELKYVTSNTELVTAVHSWFDAQVSDHGQDASKHHSQSAEETQ